MRRLLVLASTMVFFDVAFYSAIAPLLPDYVDRARAQQGGSRDPLRRLRRRAPCSPRCRPGCSPAGSGRGARCIAGLALLGFSSVVFGFADEFVLLDAARFSQGVAGALIWSGALTWLITDGAARAPRLGDRHRARDRGRRRA